MLCREKLAGDIEIKLREKERMMVVCVTLAYNPDPSVAGWEPAREHWDKARGNHHLAE